MQKLLLSLLLMGFVQVAFSQARIRPATKPFEISGLVRDSLTGQPIAKASVRLNFDKMGLYTDTTGSFAIMLTPAEYTLVISSVGYRPFRTRVNLNRDTRFDVKLMSVAKELEEVVISTQSVDQNISRPLLGVTQLNIKTIKKLPAIMGEVDVLRSLQMLPGVTSVGEASNGVNIRGGAVDQNLIMLDDAPILNPTHLFGLFSVFPPDAVSGMELYKGTTPARFGGRAAAVLDISMSNPSLEKFSLQGGVSFVANRLTAEIPLVKNKVGLLVTGRGAFNDFAFQWGPEKLRNIKAQFGDAAAKLFWRINEKNTFSLSNYVSTDFFQTDLLGGINNINSTSTQYAYNTLNFTGKWLKVINDRLDMQTVAVYSRYRPDILLPELNSDNKVEISSEILQRQFKVNFNYVPNRTHKIEWGVQAMHYQIQPGELIPGSNQRVNPRRVPTENSLETALHIEDEITLNPKTTLSVGLRYSYFMQLGPLAVRTYQAGSTLSEGTVIDSTFYQSGKIIQTYGGFEPRLGFKYSLDEQSSVKLGYNMMRQYMQVISNTTTPLPTSRWATSSPHIRPQVSQLFTAGYFRNLKNNIYEFSVEGYYRLTDNILDFKPGADFLLQDYIETQVLQGQSKSYGLELMMTKKRGELTGWVNYTYSRVFNQINQGPRFFERINDGKWYPANFDRPHNLNLSLNFSENKFHNFSLTFTYGTGRPYTTPNGFVSFQGKAYPYYAERNQSRIKDYHRLDFSWQINNPTLKDKRWLGSWIFTVYNLYGRKNQYSVFLRTKGTAYETFQLQIFASPIVSLAYNFKFM
ncbi:MAG: TonB-dependent receptor [Spirosomaceae bacterium]|jgi:TonB dependent receptor/CarboxypepD_reg-like domain/TonB-dependent Receptor Plug Domain|nr:TonB-dependent receptor [Spirosomataceae bacterium]